MALDPDKKKIIDTYHNLILPYVMELAVEVGVESAVTLFLGMACGFALEMSERPPFAIAATLVKELYEGSVCPCGRTEEHTHVHIAERKA